MRVNGAWTVSAVAIAALILVAAILYTRNLGALGYLDTVVSALSGRPEITEPVGDLPWVVRAAQRSGDSLTAVMFANGQFVAVGANGAVLTSPDGIVWTRVATLPANLLRSLTFADGVYVTVGSEGALFTASDPSTWIQHDSGTAEWLNAVVSGNGRFVAASHGFPVTSRDGSHWTKLQSGSTLRDMMWDGTHFRAVGPIRMFPAPFPDQATAPDRKMWG